MVAGEGALLARQLGGLVGAREYLGCDGHELPCSILHREAVQRIAAKHLGRLEGFPLETAAQRTFITEILPFEQLWLYAIQFLSNRFYK